MADEFTVTSERLISWLKDKGLRMSTKMALKDLRAEGRGRGVVATENISEDEVIFSIPRSAVLNIKNASFNDGVDESGELDLPPWLSLTALLMSEIAHGESSSWAPYLSTLPSSLDSLVFWSEEELGELQASTVVNKIGKADAEDQYHSKIAKLGIPGGDIGRFHRVASLIMAYAFDIPESQAEEAAEAEEELVDDEEEKTILTMVPLADMLNADADRNNARLMCDSEDLEMRAIVDITKGDEIFNDYGQLPRSDLLRRYGYITDNYKQYDVAEISSDSLVSAFSASAAETLRLTVSELESRIELADREGVFEESFDIMRSDADRPCISDELLAFMWILCADKETFEAVKKSEKSLPSRSKLATNQVGFVLGQLLTLRLKEYSTTVEEDANILKAGNCSPRKYMAVQVRIGEKEVLEEAILESATFRADDKGMRGQAPSKRVRDVSASSISNKRRKH